jgi:flagellar basal body rod protein FlgC
MLQSKDRKTKDGSKLTEQRAEMNLVSSDLQEDDRPFSENFADPYRRRLRSLSPSQLHRSKQFVQLTTNKFHATSMYDM